jgi:hypothetical protein
MLREEISSKHNWGGNSTYARLLRAAIKAPNAIVSDVWHSTDSCLGGSHIFFFRLRGDDTIWHICAYGRIDLYGIDRERTPWFDGTRKTRDADTFAVVFHDDRIEDDLNSILCDFYRQNDLANELMKVFFDNTGLSNLFCE